MRSPRPQISVRRCNRPETSIGRNKGQGTRDTCATHSLRQSECTVVMKSTPSVRDLLQIQPRPTKLMGLCPETRFGPNTIGTPPAQRATGSSCRQGLPAQTAHANRLRRTENRWSDTFCREHRIRPVEFAEHFAFSTKAKKCGFHTPCGHFWGPLSTARAKQTEFVFICPKGRGNEPGGHHEKQRVQRRAVNL